MNVELKTALLTPPILPFLFPKKKVASEMLILANLSVTALSKPRPADQALLNSRAQVGLFLLEVRESAQSGFEAAPYQFHLLSRLPHPPPPNTHTATRAVDPAAPLERRLGHVHKQVLFQQ